MIRLLIGFVCTFMLGVLWAPDLAHAGCLSNGSGCEMASAASAVVTPGSGCLEFEFDENECVCGNEMRVTNTCAEPVEAIDFEWCQYDSSTNCPTIIEPGAVRSLYLPRPGATELGPRSAALPILIGTTEHTLTVDYEMVHVQTGWDGCSVTTRSSGSPAICALAVLFVGLCLRRRRR